MSDKADIHDRLETKEDRKLIRKRLDEIAKQHFENNLDANLKLLKSGTVENDSQFVDLIKT